MKLDRPEGNAIGTLTSHRALEIMYSSKLGGIKLTLQNVPITLLYANFGNGIPRKVVLVDLFRNGKFVPFALLVFRADDFRPKEQTRGMDDVGGVF